MMAKVRNGLVAVVLAGALFSPAAAGPYSFNVEVTLSPKALAELTKRKEAIVVAAFYEGAPVPSKAKYAVDGPLDLGGEQAILPASGGRAAISGTKVKTARLGWVKRLDVLINVYSARRSDPNNLLDCGIFEDSVANARDKPIAISCKLIVGE